MHCVLVPRCRCGPAVCQICQSWTHLSSAPRPRASCLSPCDVRSRVGREQTSLYASSLPSMPVAPVNEADSRHCCAGERYVRVRDFGEHDSSDSDSESDDEDDAPDFAKVRSQKISRYSCCCQKPPLLFEATF